MAPLSRSRCKPAALPTKRNSERGGVLIKLGRSISTWRESKRVKTEGLNSQSKELKDLMYDMEGEKCGICNVSLPEIHFVTLCGHVFCSGCIKDHYNSLIHSQTSKMELTAEDILQKVSCPNQRCDEEIKRVELVDIVGLPSVQKYEAWLNYMFDVFYGPSVMEAQMYASMAQSPYENHRLPVRLWRRDLSNVHDVWLGDQRYKIYKCIAELEEAIGGFSQAKQNFKTKSKCIVESEEAVEDFTEAEQNPSEIGNKAGLPLHNIWADETCFGRESLERKEIRADGTSYGGKSWERKVAMDESLNYAAKRAELEFDWKVEKQLAFLTNVLSRNANDKSNNKPKKQPALTVPVFSLITRKNILSGLLQQLAPNDSMMDISERGSLYQAIMSLVGAMENAHGAAPVADGAHGAAPVADGSHVTSYS